METFSFDDIKQQIECLFQTDNIKPENIPSIELYMDQVTTFMEEHLGGNKRHPEDKVLTKTMINNYSKNNLLPSSNKKKYSKNHMIMLIYIYYLKNFLSINDIRQLLSPMASQHFDSLDKSMEDIYKDIYQLENNYSAKIKESIEDIYQIADSYSPEQDDYLKTFALITMLGYDIYVKKQLIEKIIDSFPRTEDEKSESKNAKAELRESKELEKQRERKRKELSRQQEKAEKKRPH